MDDSEREAIRKTLVGQLLEDNPRDPDSWMAGFTRGFRYGAETATNTMNKTFDELRADLKAWFDEQAEKLSFSKLE